MSRVPGGETVSVRLSWPRIGSAVHEGNLLMILTKDRKQNTLEKFVVANKAKQVSLFRKSKVRQSLPLVPILSQQNPVNTFIIVFLLFH
jgi:hypothetical protein